ncbi:transposase family protein [bacterium]|nr:transposase family protein [bacterium]QQR58248.1 MAG: transposase family protein [Candidatus Melainabacteria bacterium]
MTTNSRKELLEALKKRYVFAAKAERIEILESLIRATNYSRKHAITILNRKAENETKKRTGRKKSLGIEAENALIQIWHIANQICGKRLVPFIEEICENLETYGHLTISAGAKAELLSVSAATVDRVLKKERQRCQRSISHTKSGPLVKNKVPIRTFTEWNDVLPGFFEIDTVCHSSIDTTTGFLSTLNMTDIATCWIIPIALPRKGAFEVLYALEQASKMCPFPILGLDFDNGSEFLNEDMIKWCDRKHITYTRSRAHKKNDQAWIEQKNGSVIRRNVGKGRFEGSKSQRLLEALYKALYLYVNFFQPCQKLIEKKRSGAKMYKVHDRAKTPYQRVLENEAVSQEVKTKLIRTRNSLDMYALHKEMKEQQAALEKLKAPVLSPVAEIIRMQRNAVQKLITREKTEDKKVSCSIKETRSIISLLEAGSVFTCKDILQEGQQRTSIDTYLWRLEKEGMIQRCGWGKYLVLNTNFAGTKIYEATV